MSKYETCQRLVEALRFLGSIEINALSEFRVFRHDQKHDHWFYLGKGGSLRVGTCLTQSTPAYLDKKRLLDVWDCQFGIIKKEVSHAT